MSIWTILFVVLLIAWIGGFAVFHVAGGLIHLLLVLAVISLILHFVMGTRTTLKLAQLRNSKSIGFKAEFMIEHRQEQRARRELAVQVSGGTLAETLSHKAPGPAISAKVAHCYRAVFAITLRRLGLGGIPGPEGSLQDSVG